MLNKLGEKLQNTILYEKQKELILQSKKNWLYTTDTGTGKTYIALHHFLYHTKNNCNLFIVAPAQKVKENGWQKSIKMLEQHFNIEIKYNILSYDKFRKLEQGQLGNYYIILDECHFIKSIKSKRSKSIRKLLKESRGFCLLSATPFSNGDLDLLVYLEIFNLIDNSYRFMQEYGLYKNQRFGFREIRIPYSFKNSNYYKQSLNANHCSIPLKLDDMVEMPPLLEKTIWIDKSKIVKSLYKFIKNHSRSLIDILALSDNKTSELTKEAISEMGLKNSDKLLNDLDGMAKTFSDYNYEFTYNKVLSKIGINSLERQFINLEEKCNYIKMILEENDHNLVIFYNYNIEKDFILNLLNELDIKHYLIAGNTEVNFEEMEKCEERKVAVVQYQAGGSGIELQWANQCVFFSPTYSYQNFYQAKGRVYRNGQKQKTIFYYLVGRGTIEQAIYDTLLDKQDFIESMYLQNIIDNNGVVKFKELDEYIFFT